MKVLDLFAGIGGFSLAAHWMGWETVAFCEKEPYCQAVLNRNFPGIPIYDDIRTLTADALDRDGAGQPDIITGGYPCQPFSVAGKRKGTADDRHLWPEMRRLVAELRPRWVCCENVAGHIRMGLDDVLVDLEAEGYTTCPVVIPACAVNAVHRRDRVWIIAHARRELRGPLWSEPGQGERLQDVHDQRRGAETRTDAPDAHQPGSQGRELHAERPDQWIAGTGSLEPIANADSERELQRERAIRDERGRTRYGITENDASNRQAGPCFRGSDDGVPARMDRTSARNLLDISGIPPLHTHKIPLRADRLKALGNSIIPQVA